MQAVYEELLASAKERSCHEWVIKQLGYWAAGEWQGHAAVLAAIPGGVAGKRLVDFGCKFGMLAPLAREQGVASYVGIEEPELFIEYCLELYGGPVPPAGVEFVQSEEGYIPLQPDSADVVLLNEVISHVNPRWLPTVYAECHRILAPGGVLFISDGNNLHCRTYVNEAMIPLHAAYELGPDGCQVDAGTIDRCFVTRRADIIRSAHPHLTEDDVMNLAVNTSGLWGRHLEREVERFLDTGEVIERPFRIGTAPTYPGNGIVEERGFFPKQVYFDLWSCGFDPTILNEDPDVQRLDVVLDPATFVHVPQLGPFAFCAPLPPGVTADAVVTLTENNDTLPYGDSVHMEIGAKGEGRYSVWFPPGAEGALYFSASDNLDPRTNGRTYKLHTPLAGVSANFQIAATKLEVPFR